MAILDGCQEGKKTPVLREISCPKCGETVEIFLKDGKTVADAECPGCGNKIPEKTAFDL